MCIPLIKDLHSLKCGSSSRVRKPNGTFMHIIFCFFGDIDLLWYRNIKFLCSFFLLCIIEIPCICFAPGDMYTNHFLFLYCDMKCIKYLFKPNPYLSLNFALQNKMFK